MGFCKTKRCQKTAEIQKEYGKDWKEVPKEVLDTTSLCYQCISGIDLQNQTAMDRD
jgi:hypothetical protein